MSEEFTKWHADTMLERQDYLTIEPRQHTATPATWNITDIPPLHYPSDNLSQFMSAGYDHYAPNVNPLTSGFEHTYVPEHDSYNTDEEVSFYNSQSGYKRTWPANYGDRCCSTDTSVSCSSVSTSVSRGSLETEIDDNQSVSCVVDKGLKRKRDTTDGTKKSRKVSENGVKYVRRDKPPYTYTGMIITAIENSPRKELTLRDIQAKLMQLFPFFCGSYTGWRDSVRHNLSHHPCFVKKLNRSETNRLHLWTVDLSKVDASMFMRRENAQNKSCHFKATIHEHLGLPPIALNTDTSEQSKDQSSISGAADTAPTTPCAQRVSKLKMPDVFTLDVSPHQFTSRRDSVSGFSGLEIDEICPSDMNQLVNIIRSERRTSLDALQHLNSLCFTSIDFEEDRKVEISPCARTTHKESSMYIADVPCKSESHLSHCDNDVQIPTVFSANVLKSQFLPFPRDSDAEVSHLSHLPRDSDIKYNPCFPFPSAINSDVKYERPSKEMSENFMKSEDVLRACDFSIADRIRPVSPSASHMAAELGTGSDRLSGEFDPETCLKEEYHCDSLALTTL